MSKCYLLGAGFSKAVANLPLMKELTERWWKQIENEVRLDHKNRVKWGTDLRIALQLLKIEWFDRWIGRGLSSNRKITVPNFNENIEMILTWIDFITHPMHEDWTIMMEGETGERAQMLYRTLRDGDFVNWRDLRSHIETYLHLVLSAGNPSPLLGEFLNVVKEGDSIVTFNYDMLVETALYERGAWVPKDGYGFEASLMRGSVVPVYLKSKSKIPIFKLHGSLNWEIKDMFSPDEIGVRLVDNGNSEYFPGYAKKERSELWDYQGVITGYGILPTFLKAFSNPQLLQIWATARRALEESDEIVVVGYSLPSSDTATMLLLASANLSVKRISIVDIGKGIASVRERMERCVGGGTYRGYDGLQNYLEGNEYKPDNNVDS